MVRWNILLPESDWTEGDMKQIQVVAAIIHDAQGSIFIT